MTKNREGHVLGYHIVTDIWNARIDIDSEDKSGCEDTNSVKKHKKGKARAYGQ